MAALATGASVLVRAIARAAILAGVRVVVVVVFPVAEGLPGVAETLCGHSSMLAALPLGCTVTVGHRLRLAQPALALKPGERLGLGQPHLEEPQPSWRRR